MARADEILVSYDGDRTISIRIKEMTFICLKRDTREVKPGDGIYWDFHRTSGFRVRHSRALDAFDAKTPVEAITTALEIASRYEPSVIRGGLDKI